MINRKCNNNNDDDDNNKNDDDIYRGSLTIMTI
jgi:hypothetical protein